MPLKPGGVVAAKLQNIDQIRDFECIDDLIPMVGGTSTGVPSEVDNSDSGGCSSSATCSEASEELQQQQGPVQAVASPLHRHSEKHPRAPKQASATKAKASKQHGACHAGKWESNMQTCFVLSRGSTNHSTGLCQPCQKFGTQQGCVRGELCNFCHYPHDQTRLMEAAAYTVKAQLRRFGLRRKLL